MIPVIAGSGSSFSGAFAYYFHDKNAEATARVAWTHTRNMLTDCADKAWKVMAYTAKAQERLKEAAGKLRTGRKLEKPVFAYSLSWHPEQKPDKATMLKAAKLSLETLGLSDREAMISAHRDEPQPHIHIIVNRVHPVTGMAAKTSHSKRKLSDFAREWERKEGKVYCMQREENYEKRQKGQNTKYADPAYQKAWDQSENGEEFTAALVAKGYEVARGRKRLVVVDPHGKTINPLRHLEGVRAKEFHERMSDLEFSKLPTPEAILGGRNAKATEPEQTAHPEGERIAHAMAAQMTRHQDEWSAVTAKHQRRIKIEKGVLSEFYHLRETNTAIKQLKTKIETPGLLLGFTRKILGTDKRMEAQLEALKANQSNAIGRFREAIDKLEAQRDTALEHLRTRQDSERKKLAARLTGWRRDEKRENSADRRVDRTQLKPDQDNTPSRGMSR